jgi:hypothetical protein
MKVGNTFAFRKQRYRQKFGCCGTHNLADWTEACFDTDLTEQHHYYSGEEGVLTGLPGAFRSASFWNFQKGPRRQASG